MARTHTPAHERTAQRRLAQERAAAIVGRPVSQREAAAILRGTASTDTASTPPTGDTSSTADHHGRGRRNRAHLIAPAPIDLDHTDTIPLGIANARVTALRDSHGIAVATLTAYLHEASHLFHQAAAVPDDALLALDVFGIPRRLGLHDDDDFDDDDEPPPPDRLPVWSTITAAVAAMHHDDGSATYDDLTRDHDYDDVELRHFGTLRANVTEYKIGRGQVQLTLVTSSGAFGGLLRDLARWSHSDPLVCAMFHVHDEQLRGALRTRGTQVPASLSRAAGEE